MTKEKLIKMNEEIFKIELANEETIFDHSPEEFYNYYVKLYNKNKFSRYDKVSTEAS
jgi:alcohol dehydrogenase YqhD (iron-dependent ADH family)